MFMTSTLTLTRDPDSMLAAMFSGRHALRQDDDGAYFIDRDGTHFRYVLNYLRDGGFRPGTLPANACFLGELCTEAEYYQLDGLVQLVTGHINSLGVPSPTAACNAAGGAIHGGSLTACSPSANRVAGVSPSGRRLQRKVNGQQTPK